MALVSITTYVTYTESSHRAVKTTGYHKSQGLPCLTTFRSDSLKVHLTEVTYELPECHGRAPTCNISWFRWSQHFLNKFVIMGHQGLSHFKCTSREATMEVTITVNGIHLIPLGHYNAPKQPSSARTLQIALLCSFQYSVSHNLLCACKYL